jgi:hypothetical protein
MEESQGGQQRHEPGGDGNAVEDNAKRRQARPVHRDISRNGHDRSQQPVGIARLGSNQHKWRQHERRARQCGGIDFSYLAD